MDIASLQERFTQHFGGKAPTIACRAPGRVNLIGEHTDYNGLPVFPMALEQAIYFVAAPRADSVIRLRNVDIGFPKVSFQNAAQISPSPTGAWENYCKAAVQGLNDHFGLPGDTGFDVLVRSDLPSAAGLSSSSALVVGCALVYLRAAGFRLGEDISRLELAELLAKAEHYVGTRGGGMDQCCILHGETGHACKINFFPIQVETVPLPPDCAIVVCDSLVRAEKTGAALHRYNAGPRLCRLACALLEKVCQEHFDEALRLERIGDLWFGPLCLRHEEVEALCEEAFPQARTTLDEAARRLGKTKAEIRDAWLGDLPEVEGGFSLRARMRHQRTEYQRVEMARDALNAGEYAVFGALMNQSQESCARDFEISCPELDRLTEVAGRAGALGARLTGAGFGGATVNLVLADGVDAFRDYVAKHYYDKAGFSGKAPIFVAKAGQGAEYLL
jgi:N-acetylgalactosamine kinase